MKAISSVREANRTPTLAIVYFSSCVGSYRFASRREEGKAMSNLGGCWLGLRVWRSGLHRRGLDERVRRSWF